MAQRPVLCAFLTDVEGEASVCDVRNELRPRERNRLPPDEQYGDDDGLLPFQRHRSESYCSVSSSTSSAASYDGSCGSSTVCSDQNSFLLGDDSVVGARPEACSNRRSSAVQTPSLMRQRSASHGHSSHKAPVVKATVCFQHLQRRKKRLETFPVTVGRDASQLYNLVRSWLNIRHFVLYTMEAGSHRVGGVTAIVERVLLPTDTISPNIDEAVVYANEVHAVKPSNRDSKVCVDEETENRKWAVCDEEFVPVAAYVMMVFHSGRPLLAFVPFVALVPVESLCDESAVRSCIATLCCPTYEAAQHMDRQVLARVVVRHDDASLHLRQFSPKWSNKWATQITCRTDKGAVMGVAVVYSCVSVQDAVTIQAVQTSVFHRGCEGTVSRVYISGGFAKVDVLDPVSGVPHFGLCCMDVVGKS